MSIRRISFVENEYYHVYNRGNSKQKIFHDQQDYEYFLNLLIISNNVGSFKMRDISRGNVLLENKYPLVSIGAYVLMPNHFHILITQIEENGISKFMHKIGTAYSMYYNLKYKRTGGLFEGKFKSIYVDTDRYLKYLFSYIHLNPIKLIDKDWKDKGIKNKEKAIDLLNGYMYSSYGEYTGTKRNYNSIINRNKFPDYFPNKKDFLVEIFNWIDYDN